MTRTLDQIRTTPEGPRPIPASGDLPAVVAPPFVDTQLPNGLRVLLVRYPSAPIVQLGVGIPFAGTDPRHAARSALIANTILAGTHDRDRFAIDSALARVGGQGLAAVTAERLGVSAGGLASGLTSLLDVVFGVITGAAYPDVEVAQEAQKLAQTLMMQRADPGTVANEALQRRRYGDHPLARTLPDPADVVTIAPDELRALHATGVVPRGSTFVLVGDIDLDDALREVERACARWTADTPASVLPAVPEQVGGDLQIVNMPGAVQAHFRLSVPGVPRDDARYAALTLATLALGGGITGRLASVVRERLGLCYHISCSPESVYDINGEQAAIVTAVDTATETAVQALRAVRAEIQRFRDEPPSQDELDDVRRFAVGSQLMGTTSLISLAQVLSTLAATGLGVPWLAAKRELLAAVTVEDVAAAADEFLAPERFTGVVVGDAVALSGRFDDDDHVTIA